MLLLHQCQTLHQFFLQTLHCQHCPWRCLKRVRCVSLGHTHTHCPCCPFDCCLPLHLHPAALAYTLAALTPGVMVAMPAMCFILIISLILCGFMIRAPAVPVYW